jgi:hypothetical protein
MSRSVLSLLLLTGCIVHVGPQAKEYPPAIRPYGSWAVVTTTTGAHIGGELLEVRDTAWVVAAERGFVLVPFRVMQSGHVDHSDNDIAQSQQPVAPVLQEHRLLSRYPYGLSDAVLRELLASKRQAALEVIGQ